MERDAFISYSHQRDVPLAEALQKGLQGIVRTPWLRRPGLKVFRDTTSLGASSDLGSSITTALAGARYFVYLASPEAAASKWVRQEIAYWRRNHGLDHFLIALSDGRIVWDDAARDFDWQQTNAIPQELSWAFAAEPLWVDLRPYRACDPGDRSMSPGADFRDRVASLAAPLHGRTKDALDSEDLRLQRKAIRVLRGGVAVLSATTLIAAGAGVFAWQQRGEALARARTSAAQALAARALESAQGDPRKSAQFALYADATRRMGESAQALGRAVAANDNVGRHLQGGSGVYDGTHGISNISPTRVALSRDGNLMAYYSALGGPADSGASDEAPSDVRLYDIRARRELPRLTGIPWSRLHGGDLALSDDGRYLAVETVYNRIEIWDTTERRQVRTLTASEGRDLAEATKGMRAFAFSGDGRRVAAGYYVAGRPTEAYRFTVWDTATGDVVHDATAPQDAIGIAFDKDGNLQVLDSEACTVRTLPRGSTAWNAAREIPCLPAKERVYPQLSEDASTAVLWNESRPVLWDLVKGERRLEVTDPAVRVDPVLPTADRTSFIAYKGQEVLVYDATLRRRRVIGSFTFPVMSLAASGDGRWVAAGSRDGAVSLLSTDSVQGGAWLSNEDDVQQSELTPDRRAAFRTRDGGTDLWSVTGAGVKRLGRIPVPLDRGNAAETTDTVLVSADGTRAVTVHQGRTALWDLKDGTPTASPTSQDESQGLRPVSFLPDGVHVLARAGGQEGLHVVDTRTWKIRQTVRARGNVVVSGDLGTLGFSDTGALSFWRWSEHRLVHVRDTDINTYGFQSIVLSHDGRKAVSKNGDSRLAVVDVASGRVATSDGLARDDRREPVFSQDGSFVVQAAGTGPEASLQFWDSTSGEARGTWTMDRPGSDTSAVQVFAGADGAVLAFNPDGSLVRRATDLASWRTILCTVVPDPLPQGDRDRYLRDLDVSAPCRP
ncbi:TIR domain-containing protein [Streptomyces sp. WAC06614]|uniref:toll/interleukin-1 receptor domain-containing protein n=1 Tax=Streptomyces sp. WAC06614 TaxID=2487416 RepID=UPI00163CE5F3|nr:TIR domain-containing protein [Streptomyces sp. WAC06614]